VNQSRFPRLVSGLPRRARGCHQVGPADGSLQERGGRSHQSAACLSRQNSAARAAAMAICSSWPLGSTPGNGAAQHGCWPEPATVAQVAWASSCTSTRSGARDCPGPRRCMIDCSRPASGLQAPGPAPPRACPRRPTTGSGAKEFATAPDREGQSHIQIELGAIGFSSPLSTSPIAAGRSGAGRNEVVPSLGTTNSPPATGRIAAPAMNTHRRSRGRCHQVQVELVDCRQIWVEQVMANKSGSSSVRPARSASEAPSRFRPEPPRRRRAASGGTPDLAALRRRTRARAALRLPVTGAVAGGEGQLHSRLGYTATAARRGDRLGGNTSRSSRTVFEVHRAKGLAFALDGEAPPAGLQGCAAVLEKRV